MSTTDLERSPFQNLPAYRYLRATDSVPRLGNTGPDPLARVKLFNPTGSGSWYIAEYDPKTRIAYGAVNLHEYETGYFSLAELVQFRGQMGLPIERDLHWRPRRLSECEGS